jgi:hypothetical protein
MSRFSLFLFLAVTGCAAVQPLVNPVDAILAEAVAAARAPAAEQTATLVRAEKELQRAGNPSPADRLRLATLLATLPAPLRDDARAAELLEPIADASAPGIGRFAAMLSSQIMERQRLARELDRLTREAANAVRERERSEKARELLDKERDKREEALKQQLEALRAIERGILEREEKLRRRQK